MSIAKIDDGRPIRARVNPLFMSVFMVFPLMWVVLMPVALVQDGVDPGTSIITLMMFEAPVVAVIVNFFWHYRLELTSEQLSIHRYFRWGGKGIRIEDLTAVAIRPALFRAPRIVFESHQGDIRLMWRGRHGNWWPPVLLNRMLARLTARGVYVAPEVREYLINRKPVSGLSTPALVVVFGIIVVWSLAVTVAAIAAATDDLIFAMTLTAITVPILAALYGLLGALFWLNDRQYGDLKPASLDGMMGGGPAAS